ncbi:MAG: DUF479 domain-containing protein [Cytophagales bacterium]|nr:MAG: DUF479 domain-containing protein [Cytophagales bacterium]TAF62298.1 MAG: DUF479 domain-containing protein [Cytophagales bacterium]
MNYLGHSYLAYVQESFDEGLAVGHFIADFLRGSSWLQSLPPFVQRGVLMHRATDAFTDAHPASRRMAARLQPDFGKYAPVIVDVVYDHFLGKNWDSHSQQGLYEHAQAYYETLTNNELYLPEKAIQVLKNMKRDNWLFYYGSRRGFWLSLNGLARRSSSGSHIPQAAQLVHDAHDLYKSDFEEFIQDLKTFKANWLVDNSPKL